MRVEHVDVQDVLADARQAQELGRLGEARYAVQGRNGVISITPNSDAQARNGRNEKWARCWVPACGIVIERFSMALTLPQAGDGLLIMYA